MVDLGKINTRYSRRYFDEFMRLKCAPDLLAARIFPDGKELTETMAVFAAVRRILGPERLGDSKVLLLDIGAGGTPRTASFFACMSRWDCIAIDPELKNPPRFKRVRNMKNKIEHVVIPFGGLVVAACVHSHATLPAVLSSIQAPELLVVTLPCCVPYDVATVSSKPVNSEQEYQQAQLNQVRGLLKTLPQEAVLERIGLEAREKELLDMVKPIGDVGMVEWEDFGCWSPKRKVFAWRFERKSPGYWAPVDIILATRTPNQTLIEGNIT